MSAPHVVCPDCGAINRVPTERDHTAARCGKCRRVLWDGHPAHVDSEGLRRQIEKSHVPLLVDFWATWCGPCQAVAPLLDDLAASMEPRLRVLEVETDANPQAAAEHAVSALPTLALFVDGREVDRYVGALPARQLEAWVERHLG